MTSDALDAPALEAIHSRYAADMLSTANVSDPRLQDAMVSIPRERFLGEPPWQVLSIRVVFGFGQRRAYSPTA